MEPEVVSIAHVIQLSVAPVFLLTGVAAMLGILSNRLARTVDRARLLEERVAEASDGARDSLIVELGVQTRRMRTIYLAMVLCALCALLIASVIVVLFAGAFMAVPVAAAVAVLFVTAMVTFIAAMLAFLREVHLAITRVRIGLMASGVDESAAAVTDPAARA
jgi:hypothetical protein